MKSGLWNAPRICSPTRAKAWCSRVHRQPLAVHLMVNAINSALGNIGNTIVLLAAPEPKTGSIAELAKSLNDGAVDTWSSSAVIQFTTRPRI